MPRRVAHLIDTGGPGGAETVFRELATRIAGGRWRSVPIVPSAGWLEDSLERAGATPVRLSSEGSFDVAYLMRLVRLLRERRVDLLQTHLLGAAVYGNLAARICRIPVVSTFHGTVDVSDDELLRSLKFRVMDRRASRTVFVSHSLRDYVITAAGLRRERSRVIHNGIDPGVFAGGGDGSFRAELGAGREMTLVGAVGNIRPAKDYELLLETAALLRTDDTPYRFVIVGQGEGELMERLEARRARLGLEQTVVFAGFREDVPRVLADLDVYVLTSSSEGFSLSTVQALASGLPVVATQCGGPEEIITDGVEGLLVDSGRPEAMADAVRRLVGNPEEARRLARAGRRLVEEEFTLDRMVEEYEKLYEDLL